MKTTYEVRRDGRGGLDVYRDDGPIESSHYIGYARTQWGARRIIRRNIKRRARYATEYGQVVYREEVSK